jgi:hypothetical protein
LRNKWQVLDVFKEFHAKVERETGRNLKCVRSDNGGEYRGSFEMYCRKFGIRLERMNITLTERVTAMLSHAKLPNSFWYEAFNYAMYVLNLSPQFLLQVIFLREFGQGRMCHTSN